MFVTRLPKRSTREHDPATMPVVSDAACGMLEPREVAPTGRPSAVSSTPFASQAAAGAKRSRPSNVRLTVGRA